MPELPEVETIRQDLRRKILQLPIREIVVRKEKIIRNNPTYFCRTLVGNTFTEIDRVGKLLIGHIQGGRQFLLIHLKMTGQLLFQWDGNVIAGGHTEPPISPDLPNKYSHVIISFGDGSTLFFNDMRLFGFMKIVDAKEKDRVTALYGPEPLSSGFNIGYLERLFARRTAPLKAILMDQTKIAGIGNIYADEICFRAGLRPDRMARSLTHEEIKTLARAARTIIAKAITERGTTFNNYLDPEGRKGNFVRLLKVYGRGGLACLKCGRMLEKKKVAGRGTVWCGNCQQ